MFKWVNFFVVAADFVKKMVETILSMPVYFVWVDVTKFDMEFAFSVNVRNNGNAFEKNH